MRRLALIALLIAAGTAHAGKFRHHEIQDGDGTGNYQIYILGDGWRHDEMEKYHAAVDGMVKGLWEIEPYGHFQQIFRITCVDVASDVKGVTIFEPLSSYKENDGEPREKIRERKSPLGVTIQDANTDPNLSTAKVRIKEELGESWGKLAIILLNENQIKAGVSSPSDGKGFVAVSMTSGTGFDVSGVLAHEMGHAYFGLADEYCDGRAKSKTFEPPNLTLEPDPDDVKWRHITNGLLGCVAPGTDNGWKHAFASCRMQRVPYPKSFCRVCLEAMTHAASADYKPIVSHSPDKGTLYEHAFSKVTFKVTMRGPTKEYARVWMVNGRTLGAGTVQKNESGSTSEVTLGYPALSTGLNRVQFLVEDRRNVTLPVGEKAMNKTPHTVGWWVVMAGPPHVLPGISPILGWP